MEIEKMKVRKITEKNVFWTSEWIWDDIHSFLKQGKKTLPKINDFACFLCFDTDNKIVGYVCYSPLARLPAIKQSIYSKKYLDIHFGVRPDLKGTDIGVDILKRGMEFSSSFDINRFRATISTEDESTIKVYENAGFFVDKVVTSKNGKDTFFIMTAVWEEE